jgi:hypothetical protein
MVSHTVCTDWMYRDYVLYLAWWWLNEPKYFAEFLILISNIFCVYWLHKLLYYCKIQRGGCYHNICSKVLIFCDMITTGVAANAVHAIISMRVCELIKIQYIYTTILQINAYMLNTWLFYTISTTYKSD